MFQRLFQRFQNSRPRAGHVSIRIGEGDGSGRYAWATAIYAGKGQWIDGEPFGTLDEWPAYESNGDPHVPLGFIVEAIAYPDVEELRFVSINRPVAPQPVLPVVGPARVGELTNGDRFPVRIAEGNGSGMYSWREQVPTPGGGWLDGAHQGTLDDWPACELSANKCVPPGLVIMARVDPDGPMLHIQVGEC
jgi:hypothetical protein